MFETDATKNMASKRDPSDIIHEYLSRYGYGNGGSKKPHMHTMNDIDNIDDIDPNDREILYDLNRPALGDVLDELLRIGFRRGLDDALIGAQKLVERLIEHGADPFLMDQPWNCPTCTWPSPQRMGSCTHTQCTIHDMARCNLPMMSIEHLTLDQLVDVNIGNRNIVPRKLWDRHLMAQIVKIEMGGGGFVHVRLLVSYVGPLLFPLLLLLCKTTERFYVAAVVDHHQDACELIAPISLANQTGLAVDG